MKKLIILAIFAFVGCSTDEPCDSCEALYYNPTTDKYFRESTNECEISDFEGYYFVECLTIDY